MFQQNFFSLCEAKKIILAFARITFPFHSKFKDLVHFEQGLFFFFSDLVPLFLLSPLFSLTKEKKSFFLLFSPFFSSF